MEELRQFLGLAGFPVVAGLVEVAKRAAPELGERWWPLVALGLGVVFNLLVGWRLGVDLWLAGILGLVTGLAASGLYSQAKTMGGGARGRQGTELP
ncbi:MAG: hypothetical protein ACUVX1_13030 [Chloroflexota bacterium]